MKRPTLKEIRTDAAMIAAGVVVIEHEATGWPADIMTGCAVLLVLAHAVMAAIDARSS